MQLKRRSPESGSTPIELVVATLLIAMPLPFALELQQVQNNQLMAETIARHALRGALLRGQTESEYRQISNQIANEIRVSWGSSKLFSLAISCSSNCQKGSLISLLVSVGSAQAIQTQVVDR